VNRSAEEEKELYNLEGDGEKNKIKIKVDLDLFQMEQN